MKIVLCYIFPQINLNVYEPAAKRFCNTYMDFAPGQTDHDIVVVLNGGVGPGPYHHKIFNPLPVNFIEHSNYGKDIGAFQMAAEKLSCDLLVCFGSHIYFHRPGWLDRMVRAFEDNGPTVFGAWGFHQPKPHLRTTGFWLPPDLLKAYPYQISDQTRYTFEHGTDSITLWTQRLGFEPLLVTWSGEYQMKDWHFPSRDQTLFRDQWSDGRGGP